MATNYGLMCLNVSICTKSICSALKAAASSVQILYVHLYSEASVNDMTHFKKKPSTSRFIKSSSDIYRQASQYFPHHSVSVLQRYSTPSPQVLCGQTPECSLKTLLLDSNLTNHIAAERVLETVRQHYNLDSKHQVVWLSGLHTACCQDNSEREQRSYDHSALGGTFDCIHYGHKSLLGTAIAISNVSLTVGITDESMNKNKTLSELIEPLSKRMSDVEQLVKEIRPDLQYQIVSIHDPYGPTVTDIKLDCLVLSEETVKGGALVNQKRNEQGWPSMDIYTIPLVSDPDSSSHQDEKISSSSIRESKLGVLLKDPKPRPDLPNLPYLIGLTGGIASGKSSVGKRLEQLGAGIVITDILAHQTYAKNSKAYDAIVQEFGENVLEPETSAIDRRKLGTMVFGNKERLDKLNNIVWPATAELVEQQVKSLHAAGKTVCFIEAALLLEAGWQSKLHEVWSCIVPQKEAIKRIMDRNGASEEEAMKRVQSQADNKYRVDRSNVVLCTLWDYEVTQRQVEKAWKLLNDRVTALAHSC